MEEEEEERDLINDLKNGASPTIRALHHPYESLTSPI